MTKSELKDCLQLFDDETIKAATHRKISGYPFAKYTDNSSNIFNGFRVMIEQVMASRLADGDEQTKANYLSKVDQGYLLIHMHAVCDVMVRRASSIAEWAEERLQEVQS